MSLGALTTAFNPSPSCLASTNIWQVSNDCIYGPCHYFLQGPPSTSDCLPLNYQPASTAYYSPGRCPVGYTPACSQVNSIDTLTETTQTCCPRYIQFHLPMVALITLDDKCSGTWSIQMSIDSHHKLQRTFPNLAGLLFLIDSSWHY